MDMQTPADLIRASSGLWAGMQFQQHGLRLSALRTSATLRKDEWEFLIQEAVMEGQMRLAAVQDLIDANLTRDIANPLGKTEITFEKVADMSPAERSMSPVARSVGDRADFTQSTVPNFITHKDFDLNARTLEASRDRGESIDTTQIRDASRRVAEGLEDALINGGGVVIGGNEGFGYTNHPDRNTRGFGDSAPGAADAPVAWSASAKTGEGILEDVLDMIGDLHTDRKFGPYWLYVGTNISTKLDGDFKSNSDKTIRQRLLEIESLAAIRTVDQLAADNVVLVQATNDVVELADGEGIQPVQWDVMAGFLLKFKVMAIQVPIVKSDAQSRSGIVHMS